MTRPNPPKVVKVKGYAIVNASVNRIWGYYGVGVSPAQVFHCRKWAEFIMNQPEHAEEVAKGKTKIIPVTITYQPS